MTLLAEDATFASVGDVAVVLCFTRPITLSPVGSAFVIAVTVIGQMGDHVPVPVRQPRAIPVRQWSEVPETRSPPFNLKLKGGSVHGVKFSLKKKSWSLGLTR